MASKLEILKELIEPAIEALGCELWGIEFNSPGRHHRSVLRVYIDSDSGVGIDDCERVSRQISSVMDVEDPIAGEYTLEVSSPGLDRPLFTLKQYGEYSGHKAKVKLRVPFEGRRNFTGMIKGIEGDDVVLIVDDQEYLLPIDSIDKGSIVPNFNVGSAH